ncbi:putative toxin-antitoxin system toxin component, PIN family [Mucilaginibacter sp.]|uniref:putative toxin-antitoxin system toxin component, PIN family n=1 Tax=Mucilaginibacter sp. TaxID=1882438 RepID=UPI00260F1520|nr:putative toxin-antitoxin system toxin component, PIN family [Mucilaginibacter sp.]MDB4923596.1 putative toxin-antitoxin system toxin component, family [Mucilaginibacter sp.]
MQNNIRIILDTNLWISFLLTKDFSKLDQIIFGKQCTLIFSKELVEEFLEVAKRPKFRRFFSQTDIEDILETIYEHADFTIVKTNLKVCRDPKDDFLLSLSVDGKVDFLLTGDKDLLDLKTISETKIITISEFLKDK